MIIVETLTPERRAELQQRRKNAILSYSIDPLVMWVFAKAKVATEPAAARDWLIRALAWRANESPDKEVRFSQLETEACTLFANIPSEQMLHYTAFGTDIPRTEITAFLNAA